VATGIPPASDAETLRRMQRQRQKDTHAEVLVRSLLHRLGYRFRTKNRDLPGSPDAANRSRRWALFVHGCYWHQHPGCPRATLPKRNREFWEGKFADNRARDQRVAGELEADGYTVVTVWECETEESGRLEERLRRELAPTG
jgi:DNA mismatch endonuclease, patch repair protein